MSSRIYAPGRVSTRFDCKDENLLILYVNLVYKLSDYKKSIVWIEKQRPFPQFTRPLTKKYLREIKWRKSR